MSEKEYEPPTSATPSGVLGSIGAYQLTEVLRRTRVAEEFLAHQRGPGGFERVCLLKVAQRNRTDLRGAEMLGREAKVLMRLDHPCIVRFHDFFELGDRVVLVLEYFSGLTLERFLELLVEHEEVLDERITWHVALALFEALAHVHGLGGEGESGSVVHRNISPSNVLLSSSGRVRVTGFSAVQDGDTLQEATALGEIVRVPSYLAPEQLRGSAASEEADAFSAALIVWELLTGQRATPEGLSEFDLLKVLSTRHPDSLRVLRPDVPALVTTALDLCLMPNPQERRIRCEEVAGCISAGLPPGDGATVLRETIARMGPAVEKLAGGKAQSTPPSRRPGSTPPLPSRPEQITLPDRVRISARMEAAVTAIPRAPGSRPSLPSLPAALPDLLPDDSQPSIIAYEANEVAEKQVLEAARQEEPTTEEIVVDNRITAINSVGYGDAAAESGTTTPAPAFTHSNPYLPAETGGDDDLDLLHAAQKRRRIVRVLVLVIPVLLTLLILLFALANGAFSSNAGLPPPLPTTIPTEPTSRNDDSDRVPEPSTPSKPSMPSAGTDQAVLVVRGPPTGMVYVMGKPLGATDSPILTDCGQRFVRVGSEMGAKGLMSVQWLAKGQSVQLRCGETTTITADPSVRAESAGEEGRVP
jgi:serine/threonine-protein kinase